MKRLLPKVLFTISFILVAVVCVSFLYGYRLDLEDRLIQKRGVVFIHGKGEVSLTLDKEKMKVTLPYTNTNLLLGTHTIVMEKDGYLPFSTQIVVGETSAVLLSGNLAPHWPTTNPTLYNPNEEIQYSITPTGLLIEYFSNQGKLFLYSDIPNIRQKTPNNFITLSPNTKRGKLRAVSQVNDALYLATFEGEDILVEFNTKTQRSLVRSASEELFTERKRIFAWDETKGTLALYDESTGTKTSTVWTDLKDRKIVQTEKNPISLYYSPTLKQYVSLQESLLGRIELLPSNFQPETISRFAIKNTTYSLTSTGALMRMNEEALSEIAHLKSAGGIEYALAQNGDIFTLGAEKPLFATRFSSKVENILSSYNDDYVFVAEARRLFYCEKVSLSACAVIFESEKPVTFSISTDSTVLFVKDELGDISTYFSAASDE